MFKRLPLVMILIVGLLAGCAKRAPLGQYTQISPTLEGIKQGKVPNLPDNATFLYSDSPEVQRAVKEFEKTGKAAIIKTPGFIRYPYGETQPLVYCQPLRACDVELEAGEEILGIALGDQIRWLVDTIYSGSSASLVPHLIIKPTEFALNSNLVVTTTRRVYHIGLISSEKDYVRRFSFYYPRALVAQAASKAKLENLRKRKEQEMSVATLPEVNPGELNFGYQIKGDYDVPWRPARVFDDGTRVFIQMPSMMRSTEAPALMLRGANKKSVELVNYRVKRNYYVVDKLFEEAILIAGTGRRRHEVIIRRK